MISEISKVTPLNFNQFVSSLEHAREEEVSDIFCDFIDNVPFMAKIISQLALHYIDFNPNFKSKLLSFILEESGSSDVKLSRCIYAAYFGANTNISDQIPKISALLSHHTVESGAIAEYENDLNVFYCSIILKNLGYNKRECINRLLTLSPDGLIKGIAMDQSLFNISILIQACGSLPMLEALEKLIHLFNMKNHIIALVFISNYSSDACYNGMSRNPTIEQEKEIMKRLISGDALDYCLKTVNRKFLGLLLDRHLPEPAFSRITHKEFRAMHFECKNDFLKAFLDLTSPSVSHFFSYLEIYKSEFMLEDENKKAFVEMLRECHKENPRYIEVVLPKMVSFGIISEADMAN